MKIHLVDKGQQMGTFSRDKVEDMIRSGAITYETLAWTDSQTAWRPLRDIIGATAPPLPPIAESVATKELNPVLAYLIPVGRIGRGEWVLRNFAHTLVIFLLAIPFADSRSYGAEFWMILLFLLWNYLTIVSAGKRYHDLNSSAWFSPLIYIPLMGLFLLILSGTKGPNKYGPEP
jgi:uncharacterized membrane protein YhaH (DUF805 family)